MNINGTHYETANFMKEKMATNFKIIDEMPVHRWHKISLAQWLISSIAMYYLVNGRVNSKRFGKWNRDTKRMIRVWVGAKNMATSTIHLPTNKHGFEIADIEDINDERKITLFTQFLHSNDIQIRESTIANLKLELGRKRVVLAEGYNVLAVTKMVEKEV
jgi:hypothetical protein